MRADRGAHILVHLHHVTGRQIGLRVEERKRTLLFGQINGGQTGCARNRLEPLFGLRRSLIAAIAQPQHQQRIRQPGHTQSDTPFGVRLARLRLKREFGDIHHVVHHAHSGGDQALQGALIQLGGRFKRIGHQPRKVDRPQQARPIGRQRLFPTGICRRNGFAISQVVRLVDPIDENHPRFGVAIGGLHDLVPQIARLHGVIDPVIKDQLPRPIRLDCFHEGIRHQHRHVEHPQPRRIGFGCDEILDVGMIATHRGHHRTAPRSGGHDRAAHRIPDIHKAERPRSIRRDAQHIRTLGPNGAEIIAYTTALLHGQSGFLEHVKNATHAVWNGAHDKTIEQGHPPRGPCTGGDPARRQVFEILQGGIEVFLPLGRILFDLRQVAGDAPPCVLDRDILGRAIRRLEPVFHVPYLFGDGGGKSRHGESSASRGEGR